MSETEAASTLCFVDTNIWLYAFIIASSFIVAYFRLQWSSTNI
jgi:hypothetical protein